MTKEEQKFLDIYLSNMLQDQSFYHMDEDGNVNVLIPNILDCDDDTLQNFVNYIDFLDIESELVQTLSRGYMIVDPKKQLWGEYTNIGREIRHITARSQRDLITLTTLDKDVSDKVSKSIQDFLILPGAEDVFKIRTAPSGYSYDNELYIDSNGEIEKDIFLKQMLYLEKAFHGGTMRIYYTNKDCEDNVYVFVRFHNCFKDDSKEVFKKIKK